MFLSPLINFVDLPFIPMDNSTNILEGFTLKDEKSFEILFKTHYDALVRFVYKYLNDLEESEEIVQDVFYTLWNKSDNLKIQSSIKSYLYQAARNKSLNIIKHNKVKQKHVESIKNSDLDYSDDAIQDLVKDWISNECNVHELFVSRSLPMNEMIRAFINMSVDDSKASLDYCIGQVWRHCQPTIYKSLSHNSCSDEVFNEIINLDERLKRYSYGPPVLSLLQLEALINADVIETSFLDDPDIDLTLSGHTHGMQFGIEIGDFKWSPVQYMYEEWADHYSHNHQHIYVNRGFGYLGLPGRIGIPPEITILELTAA